MVYFIKHKILSLETFLSTYNDTCTQIHTQALAVARMSILTIQSLNLHAIQNRQGTGTWDKWRQQHTTENMTDLQFGEEQKMF